MVLLSHGHYTKQMNWWREKRSGRNDFLLLLLLFLFLSRSVSDANTHYAYKHNIRKRNFYNIIIRFAIEEEQNDFVFNFFLLFVFMSHNLLEFSFIFSFLLSDCELLKLICVFFLASLWNFDFCICAQL